MLADFSTYAQILDAYEEGHCEHERSFPAADGRLSETVKPPYCVYCGMGGTFL